MAKLLKSDGQVLFCLFCIYVVCFKFDGIKIVYLSGKSNNAKLFKMVKRKLQAIKRSLTHSICNYMNWKRLVVNLSFKSIFTIYRDVLLDILIGNTFGNVRNIFQIESTHLRVNIIILIVGRINFKCKSCFTKKNKITNI